MDLADEIFIKRIYTPSFLQVKPSDVVLDIGANIGVFSLYAAKCGASLVYSLEPLYQNTALISKNFKINKLKEPIIIRKAVSDTNGVSDFYLGDLDSHGRLLENDYKTEINNKKKVKTIKLTEIFARYDIKRIDFLKIDCEGGEGNIIQSLSGKDWSKISKISLEYHDDVSTLSHQKIIELLERAHFKVQIQKIDKTLGYIYGWRE
jgi:FkbM family methyltransferase